MYKATIILNKCLGHKKDKEDRKGELGIEILVGRDGGRETGTVAIAKDQ